MTSLITVLCLLTIGLFLVHVETELERNLCLPRFLHGLYAFFTRHYWSPCYMCGRYHGGHESWKSICLTLDSTHVIQVCEKCKEKAKEQNRLNYERWGW